jgi:hypothetical protein
MSGSPCEEQGGTVRDALGGGKSSPVVKVADDNFDDNSGRTSANISKQVA